MWVRYGAPPPRLGPDAPVAWGSHIDDVNALNRRENVFLHRHREVWRAARGRQLLHESE